MFSAPRISGQKGLDAAALARAEELARTYSRHRLPHLQRVLTILESWNVPVTLRIVAWLHSSWAAGVLPEEKVLREFGLDVLAILNRFSELNPPGREGYRITDHYRRLALFFRTAYESWEALILPLANYLDGMRQEPDSKRRALEGQHVFYPLLNMFGLWPEAVEVIHQAIETLEPARYRHVQRRYQRGAALRQAVAQVFVRDLRALLQRQGIAAEVLVHERSFTAVLRFPQEELPNFTVPSVEVVTESDEACYRVLGAVHLHWPAISEIRDNVTRSRVNGYRAIRTQVQVPLLNHRREANLVDVSIVSQTMRQVNRFGVLAYHGQHLQSKAWANCWWNRREAALGVFRSHQGGGKEDSIYVFSPLGEVVVLPRESTLVDYAYWVHSRLAAHTDSWRVNGMGKSPDSLLHNGDVVELHFGRMPQAINGQWLAAAKTRKARSRIQAWLNRQSSRAERGRHLLEKALRPVQQHYHVVIPKHRLEEELKRLAEIKHLTVDELLSALVDGRLSADGIVQRFVARSLSRYIVFQDGEPALTANRRVSLALCCQPTPQDEIVGYVKERRGYTQVRVHTADCQIGRQTPGEIVSLRWHMPQHTGVQSRLTVFAHDYQGLLGSLLRPLYDVGLEVTEVHATTTRSHSARISFSVKAQSHAVVEAAQQALLHQQGVTTVEADDILPGELLFSEGSRLEMRNPYSRQPVRSPAMFFGREREIDQLRQDLWMASGGQLLLLQGQRRVGKSSFLLHLHEHALPGSTYLSVYMNTQRLHDNTSAGGIFYALAQEIQSAWQKHPGLRDTIPTLPNVREKSFQRDPWGAFDRFLSAAEKSLERHQRRLLVLWDEFTYLLYPALSLKPAPTFYASLRDLIWRHERVSWVLTFQAAEITRLPSHHPLRALLDGTSIYLDYLGEDAIHRMITQPMHSDFSYRPEVVAEIFRLTQGSPYLTQVLCYNIVRQMAHRPEISEVTMDILRRAKNTLFSARDRAVHHLWEHLGPDEHCLLKAFIVQRRESLTIEEITTWMLPEKGNCPFCTVDWKRGLDLLRSDRILVAGAGNRFRIRVPLLQEWLQFAEAMPWGEDDNQAAR